MTLATRTPLEDLERTLCKSTLEELCERGYTQSEIAEFTDTSERDVSRALGQYDLETRGHAPGEDTVAHALATADDWEGVAAALSDDDGDAGRTEQADLRRFS